MQRRAVLELMGLGAAIVFVPALGGCASVPQQAGCGADNQGPKSAADCSPRGDKPFYFVQISDTHWGYQGAANPDASHSLPKAVAAINALPQAPDFVFFTGDLTHSVDDPNERRRRMQDFKRVIADLKAPRVHMIPGEHDAALDRGAAFIEMFGPTHQHFVHGATHFIALDNVSDPGGAVDDAQLQWLDQELAGLSPSTPLVVFAHRPLFDLAPQWDWATRNGSAVTQRFAAFEQVSVFYGHIHQAHVHQSGHISHYAARSTMFALPAPGSQPKRTPLPWDPAHPYQGLGVREIEALTERRGWSQREVPLEQS